MRISFAKNNVEISKVYSNSICFLFKLEETNSSAGSNKSDSNWFALYDKALTSDHIIKFWNK